MGFRSDPSTLAADAESGTFGLEVLKSWFPPPEGRFGTRSRRPARPNDERRTPFVEGASSLQEVGPGGVRSRRSGASPGASTSVSIMLQVIERCFGSVLARTPGRQSLRRCPVLWGVSGGGMQSSRKRSFPIRIAFFNWPPPPDAGRLSRATRARSSFLTFEVGRPAVVR